MPAGMPRAANSAGVGRLTVTHARLLVLNSSPRIRDCSQSSYLVSGIVHSMAFSCIVDNGSIAVCYYRLQ